MSDETDVPSESEILTLIEAANNAETLGGPDEPKIELKRAEKPAEDQSQNKQAEKPKTEEKPKESKDSSLKDSDKKSEEATKSKYAQERERQELSWKKINDEKAKFQEEQKRFIAEREAYQRKQVQSQPFRDEHGYSAQDYVDFAKQAEAKGEKDLAAKAFETADKVKVQEEKARAEAQQKEVHAEWAKDFEAYSKDNPELKDEKSELYQGVQALLKEYKALQNDPKGLSLAVKATLVNRQHKEIQSVSEENKKLKAEIESLQKKLSLSSGVAAEPPKEDVEFDKLSDNEQRSRLLKMLETSPDW